MKNKSTVILIIIAVFLGYLIGTNLDIFISKSTKYSPAYVPDVPKNIRGESLAFSDIVKAITPAVVNISTTKTVNKGMSRFFDSPFGDFFESFRIPKKWKEQSLGSGVLVSSDGYIITNNHVVEKSDEIKVTLFDKQSFKGKVVGLDPKTDIAVIKIPAKGLPAIKWGNSDDLQVGEFVLAFGNPFGFSNTVTMGIVSAVGRANVGVADYEDFIQTDAAINPGNSGGPLVNIQGELVGINAAIFSRTGGYQGIGFAVPSNMAESVMKQLIKNGKVTRGWFGITLQNITPELARKFGLAKPAGALISDVVKGSPAEKAGVIRGDVILEINGKKIKDVETLRSILSQIEIGKGIKLKIMREGKPVFLKATIEEFPEEMAKIRPKGTDKGMAEENTLAGFHVIGLSIEIAKQLGLSRGEKGVVIVSVDPYSAAEEAGLQKGDVIQEINRKKVGSERDFNNIALDIKEGDSVLIFINRGGKKFYITLKVYS